ncbi:hypothetical protein GCM10010284_67870 [Streptomyces rubiginosohelvolus]|nr:hypothetical protein GCM10010284_67870 [Streptomyces rubiginosohelvolus]
MVRQGPQICLDQPTQALLGFREERQMAGAQEDIHAKGNENRGNA